MRRRQLVLTTALVTFGASACSSGNVRARPEPAVGSAIPIGQARLTFTRAQAVVAIGISADVSVNNLSAGDIFAGQSTTIDVSAGPTVVAVRGAFNAGRYALRFPTVAGTHYTFEVAPNVSAVATAAFFGPVVSALHTEANPEQSGPFLVRLLSETRS